MTTEILYEKFKATHGVSTDTRKTVEGTIFFALSGSHFDGSTFVDTAIDKGANYVVTDNESSTKHPQIIQVPHVLTALQNLAAYHSRQCRQASIPIIAITGSNGKTTTKELMVKVLQKRYVVHATKGNLNNHIGVPLTILGAPKESELLVIEMGANHQGEIATLCKIAQPTHGLITNIGYAHTEGFGGIDGVKKGKLELFDYLAVNQGTILLNTHDDLLATEIDRFKNIIKYPPTHCDITSSHPFLSIQYQGTNISSQLLGSYNFDNIVAAITAGAHFGISMEDISAAIHTYQPTNARSQVLHIRKMNVILDAYNANPTSMKAAMSHLSTIEGKKIAVIGDMNEIEDSNKSHLQLLKYAKQLPIDEVYTIGEKMKQVDLSSAHLSSKDALEELLDKLSQISCTVLLKASRSLSLESVLKKFT